MKIENDEWQNADEAAKQALQNHASNYTGLMKIDKKASGLSHSFMAVVENGQIKDMMGMARKKVVGVGEGILGEGAFSVVALAVARDGTEYAMKIQGGPNKHAIKKNAVASEMGLLQAAGELKAEGFLNNARGKEKHYAFMKKKQGHELFKQLYLPVTQVKALELQLEGKSDKLVEDEDGKVFARIDLSRKEQLLLAIKSLQGIEYLHDQNIVHRDIKPENIMTRFGDKAHKDIIIVSPTDYGLSHQLQQGETIRMDVNVSGTPGYLAPEVKKGKLCKQNDIYSLGVMFKDDFRMDDVYIEKMIAQNFNERPTAAECRAYFEAELRKVLLSEHQDIRRHLPGFSEYKDKLSQKIDVRMEQLLADEATLLKALSEDLPPESKQASNIKSFLNQQKETKTLENAATALVDGFKMIVNILLDQDTRSEKKEALKETVSALGERIQSLFGKKEKPFQEIATDMAKLQATTSPPTSRPRSEW